MATVVKTPQQGGGGRPTKTPGREPLTRQQRWLTVALWVAIMAVFALLMWLSTLGGAVNGVDYDYWLMP